MNENIYPDRGLLMDAEELEKLKKIMKGYDVKAMLEIGVYRLGSIREFNKVIVDGYIIGLDIQKPSVESLNEVWEECKRGGNAFTFMEYDSAHLHAAAALNKLLLDTKGRFDELDMLFIDGNHDGYYPYGDFERYSPFVKKGGLIVFDDINYEAVGRAYDRACKDYPNHIEINASKGASRWNGLGIIIK